MSFLYSTISQNGDGFIHVLVPYLKMGLSTQQKLVGLLHHFRTFVEVKFLFINSPGAVNINISSI